MAGALNKVEGSTLFISEPDPSWFGNGPNPRKNKHWSNENWLKSRFHFSFAEYHDRKRSQFGVLRVMNDDLVQPERGFGTHPHRDMEICTYIVKGELTHADSMGTRETLGRGSIQFMTAGTGVRHSEFNDAKSPLRFIQMWIVPRSYSLPPNYGSFEGTSKESKADRTNQWAHLVTDVNNKSAEVPVKINQDANIYVAELEPGFQLPFKLGSKRQAYILCLEGDVAVQSEATESSLSAHDAVKAFGETQLSFASGEEGTHVLIVEMALA